MKNRQFLIDRMADEWDAIQRSARRHEMTARVTAAGKIIAKTILTLAVIGGVLTVTSIAPNIFGVLGSKGRRGFFEKAIFRKTMRSLQKRQYILVRKNNTGCQIIPTNSGARVILSRTLNELTLNKSQRWDGIWRIVMFDIPTRYNFSRDAFRNHLKRLGFYQMQASVFVTPFPCEEEMRFLTPLLNITAFIRIVRTKEIAHDEDLRSFFDIA